MLHIFGPHGGSDGASPVAGLIADATGTLYGTTREGGGSGCSFSFGCGTAFKLTPPATARANWTEQVLYRFKGNSDGANPLARWLSEATALC